MLHCIRRKSATTGRSERLTNAFSTSALSLETPLLNCLIDGRAYDGAALIGSTFDLDQGKVSCFRRIGLPSGIKNALTSISRADGRPDSSCALRRPPNTTDIWLGLEKLEGGTSMLNLVKTFVLLSTILIIDCASGASGKSFDSAMGEWS